MRFFYPRFNTIAQFPQTPFKEMVCAFDNHQFLRVGKRSDDSLQFRARPKLIAVAAYEQLGFHAIPQKLEIINSVSNRSDRQTKRDDCSHARIRTRRTQSHRSPKRESAKDQRQMNLAIQPVERNAHVLYFTVAVVVLALAQSRAAEIKPQHGIAKTVQGLHSVKNDFVVQSSAIKRMGMAHQRSPSSLFHTHIEQGFQPAGLAVEEQRADGTGVCI